MVVNVIEAYKSLGFAFESFLDSELSGEIYSDDPLKPMMSGQQVQKDRDELPAIKVDKKNKIVFINWMEMYKRLPDVRVGQGISAREQLERAFDCRDVKELIKWFEIIIENKGMFEDGIGVNRDTVKNWEVRFYNFPERRRITELTSEDRERLVTIQGVPIVRGGEVYAHPETISWECVECGNQTVQLVKRGEKIKPLKRPCVNLIGDPAKPEKQFMCQSRNYRGGNVQKYKNFFNMQIESVIDETPNKIEPPTFLLEFCDNICAETYLNELHLGSAYKFTGIIQMKETSDKQGNRRDIPYMEVMAFEEIERKKFDLNIDEVEKQQIVDFLKNPDSLETVTNMCGNRVSGYKREKKFFILAKLMQERFNKVKQNPKNYIMHLLIVGNYARGKSELTEVFQEICENPFYIIGSATSGVGLAGITIRDELTGMYGIQAGVLARASNDSLFLEEYDKTKDKADLGILNEAMSKFQYTIAKGGKHRTFKSHTQVVMVANPEKKNFDEEMSLIPQINISGDLLSRFSAISCILSSKDIDRELMINKIMIQRSTEELYQKDQQNAEFIKKCLKIASENEPKMDVPEVIDFVNNFTKQAYVLSNQTYGGDKDFYSNITPRHRMTLIKVIKAVAMWHLHPVPTKEDMEEGFKLISKFWSEFIEKPKLMNMQEIEQGMSMEEIEERVAQEMTNNHWDVVKEEKVQTKKGKVELFIDMVKAESDKRDDKMMPIDDAIKIAVESLGFTERQVEELVNNLKRQGDLFEPRQGFLKGM